ncbi:glycosyltransferase family 2 protein [Methylocaldum sp.]|uniref:glycosyltransferase family 2 protein n=1 Tax=Methylocaldum sp. TaxID=1969727 RepID=UPI002D69F895|nr:glycosyltransferase family 2 protein [Methylocaldum sp.]HYE36820.1 glycosyltransferase family 2 protein [Methylocaldum sp.]
MIRDRAASHELEGFGAYALVIPAFNEAATIREVVTAALQFVPRVIVVDDGSTDGTSSALEGLGIELLRNETNQGKAASLWRGLQHALREDDVVAVMTMDGDGQHDPLEIPKLLRAAHRFPRHVVIGSRLWNKAAIPPARYRANRFANFWIAWASGQPIEDSQSGFRVYPAELIRSVTLSYSRDRSFVFESEILIEAARMGFYALPARVSAVYRDNARPSHFRPVTDIVRITRMVAWKLITSGLYPKGLWRSLTMRPFNYE